MYTKKQILHTPFLSAEQIRKELNISSSAFKKLSADPKFPKYKIGNTYKYSLLEIRNYLVIKREKEFKI